MACPLAVLSKNTGQALSINPPAAKLAVLVQENDGGS